MRWWLIALLATAAFAITWSQTDEPVEHDPPRPALGQVAVYHVDGPPLETSTGPIDLSRALVWWSEEASWNHTLDAPIGWNLHVQWPAEGAWAKATLWHTDLVDIEFGWIDAAGSTGRIADIETQLPTDETDRLDVTRTLAAATGPCFRPPAGDTKCDHPNAFPTSPNSMPWPGGGTSVWTLLAVGNLSDLPVRDLPALTPPQRESTTWQGPRAAGLLHPAPLHAGLNAVRDQASIAAFRTTYPEAFVSHASYLREYDFEGNDHHSWAVELAASGERLLFDLSYKPIMASDRAIPIAEAYSWEITDLHRRPGGFPERPAHAPSLSEAADAYAELSGHTATAYGWKTICPEQCTAPTFEIVVGRNDARLPQVSYLGLQHGLAPRSDAQDWMWFNGTGFVRWDLASQETTPLEAFVPRVNEPTPSFAAPKVSDPVGWQRQIATAALIATALVVPKLIWSSLFSRVPTDALLQHAGRKRIHETIEASPGIHFRALAREVGLGRGTLDHHLRKLLAGGLVLATREGALKRYRVPGATEKPAVLNTPAAKAIWKELEKGGSPSTRDLARRCSIAPSTASTQVRRLIDAGLIERESGFIQRIQT